MTFGKNMIIKFDRTPEEYFSLSRSSLGRAELDQALFYAEKALRGKPSTEYKVSYAEILIAMGRYAEAVDVALDALCYGRGMRAELFDVLARASSELGHFYESLHYIAKKAHYEGDDDTLDAMDEVMQELDPEHDEKPDKPDFFIVGKEEQKSAESDPMIVMRANFALSHGEVDEALRIASEATPASEQYLGARIVCLRAYLKRKQHDKAVETAEEIISLDPKNGFVLYVLIDKYKKKQYVPLLAGVEDGGSELYYAILTAENLGEHAVACRLAEKLIGENPYVPGAYFVSAAAYLNNGDKKRSEQSLKRLFSLYRKYPQDVIVKGWRRLKKCAVGFSGRMPDEVVNVLETYVKKHARTAEEFVASMLTDQAFRDCVLLVLDEGSRKTNERILGYFAQKENRHVDAFFSKMLLRYEVDLILKREIFATLYLRKNRGRLYVAQSVVPIRISCEKPIVFEAFPLSVKQAYAGVYSFVMCMTDAECEARLQTLAMRVAAMENAEKLSVQTICGALLHRLLSEGLIPFGAEANSAEDACRFLLDFIFGYKRGVNVRRIRALSASLRD